MPRSSTETKILIALKNVEKEITNLGASGNKYACGLASEGWSGGYAKALSDVMLAQRGINPRTRGYWDGIEGLE